jgi:endonuclease G
MKKSVTIGGIIAVLLLIGAIAFCAWIAPKINKKLSEINEPLPEKTQKTSPPDGKTDLPTAKQPDNPSEAERIYLALGNPSKARANPVYADNYLLVNNFYALSYNRDKGIANWVAWQLTKEDLGGTERQNDFRPDERLPANWKKIYPSYYSRSGYDRGHIVPSADRTRKQEANSATFLMTNITPQTPDLNQGPWEKLERFSRSMARRTGDLYIYSGGYGEKAKLRKTVSVPTNFWKIIVVVPRGSNIDANTRVIAVDFPNMPGIRDRNWRDYRTTVRNIEQKTGYDFLTVLPKDLQNKLETKVDSR